MFDDYDTSLVDLSTSYYQYYDVGQKKYFFSEVLVDGNYSFTGKITSGLALQRTGVYGLLYDPMQDKYGVVRFANGIYSLPGGGVDE